MQVNKDLEPSSRTKKTVETNIESTDSSVKKKSLGDLDQQFSTKEIRNKQQEIEENEKLSAEIFLDSQFGNQDENKVTSNNLKELVEDYFPNNKKAFELAQARFDRYKTFGKKLTVSLLLQYLRRNLTIEKEVSIGRKAINLKEKLISEGKSDVEILKTLIESFKKTPELSTFVENWTKFLKLWDYAQDKPTKEKQEIEKIIGKSVFTAQNSFDLALSEIECNTNISDETKIDIQRKFKTTGIKTVKEFDSTLKNEKAYKLSLEKKIRSKGTDLKNLDKEIDNLKEKLNKLPQDDSEREKIFVKLKMKSKAQEKIKKEISVLGKAKPDNVQFKLRNDLLAILRPDGSRSVKILSENFTIRLPSNKLPFMGTKNLSSINVAFPYLVLRSLNIADEIFTPNLVNNSIPTKSQRDMAHLILSSLGLDDSQILYEKDVVRLKDDLYLLVGSKTGKTGRESLIELGIYNLSNQSVNKNQLKRALQLIRENRVKKQYSSILKELTEKNPI